MVATIGGTRPFSTSKPLPEADQAAHDKRNEDRDGEPEIRDQECRERAREAHDGADRDVDAAHDQDHRLAERRDAQDRRKFEDREKVGEIVERARLENRGNEQERAENDEDVKLLEDRSEAVGQALCFLVRFDRLRGLVHLSRRARSFEARTRGFDFVLVVANDLMRRDRRAGQRGHDLAVDDHEQRR